MRNEGVRPVPVVAAVLGPGAEFEDGIEGLTLALLWKDGGGELGTPEP